MECEVKTINKGIEALRKSFIEIEKESKNIDILVSVLTHFTVEAICNISFKNKCPRKVIFNKFMEESINLASV